MIILHSMAHPTVFAFFGHPGAGKSTLLRRFAELTGVAALDTDAFMTAQEVAAVEAGRYTQAMRLANIDRYCERVRTLLRSQNRVAIADGLPNAAARRYLRDQLPGATVVFVLVSAPRSLWEQRLAARGGNAVNVGVAEAEAYVRDHWQPLPPSFEHEVVENGADAAATDALLAGLHRRYASAEPA
jgi:predicted kinase